MKKIAFFTPSVEQYSETFIRNHIDGLNGFKSIYHNGYLPRECDGFKLQSPSKWKVRLLNRFWNKNWSGAEWALCQSLRKLKPDFVFVEYGTTAVHILSVVQHLRIPMGVHFHGYDISVYKILEQYQRQYKEVLSYAGVVFAVSRKMIQTIESLHGQSKKIIYTPCGANPIFFSESERRGAKVFVTIGRMVEKKGLLYTLMAFYKVAQQRKDVKLWVVGDGPLKGICQDYVLCHGLSDQVHFWGIKTPEQIKDLLESSFCFVQHSHIAQDGDMEGTPVAIMEAMLSGLPIIATQHAGIPDIVKSDYGILVNEKDVSAMSEAMIYLLDHPAIGEEMGKMGQYFIKNNHTADHHLEVINAAISNLL